MELSTLPFSENARLGPKSAPTTSICSVPISPSMCLSQPSSSQASFAPIGATSTTCSSRLSTIYPPLDPRVSLQPLSPASLPQFRRLNSTLLPINYPDRFYASLLEDEKRLCFGYTALWSDQPFMQGQEPSQAQAPRTNKAKEKGYFVGGISVRLDPIVPDGNGFDISSKQEKQGQAPHALYISTLSVLAPYRSFGIGSHLISTAITRALDLIESLNIKKTPQEAQITLDHVYAHVWEKNPDAAEWYSKRGFEVGEVIEGYYRRLKPGGARLVRKGVIGAAVAAGLEHAITEKGA